MNSCNNDKKESPNSTQKKDKRISLKVIFGAIGLFFITIKKFFVQDVWDIDINTLPFLKRQYMRAVRIVTMVTRGFRQDECALHASSLTFMTLLSFIPILALAISLVRLFSYDDSLRDKSKELVREYVIMFDTSFIASTNNNAFYANTEKDNAKIVENGSDETSFNAIGSTRDAESAANASLASLQEVDLNNEHSISIEKIEEMIDAGFDKVEQINFNALGGIGLLFLIWAVISVLGQVESAFNRVWGVVENRAFARKFFDYLGVLIIFPLLGAAATSLPVFNVISDKMNKADNAFFLSNMAGIPLFKVAWVLLILTLAFGFLLRFTPNTTVKIRPALIGGFVVAVGFSVWLKICMALQIGVAKYSTFFGSFAIVPIILSWVYVSWEIILFGVEISYAVQNVSSYEIEYGWNKASVKTRILLAVALLRESVHQLTSGNGLLDLREFSKKCHVSIRLARSVAHELVLDNVLIGTAGSFDVYAIRTNVEAMTVGDVFHTILSTGTPATELGVSELLTSINVEEELAKSIISISDLKLADMPLNKII